MPDPLSPDYSVEPALFEQCMAWLAKEKYDVVALRALADSFEPAPIPSDPMTRARWPERE